MTKWSNFELAEPRLAGLVRARFEGHPHHVLGTVRRDGSPRLNGINVFIDEGRLWFGSMPAARKADDIFRDPRVSFYSAPLREDMSGGDASISGKAIPLSADIVHTWRPENPADGVYFEVEIDRVHLVEVVDDELVVSMWDNQRGVRIVKRQ